MNDIILEIKKLNLAVKEESLLQNISFELKEGDKVCLQGDSGVGKSLFLQSLVLLQDIKFEEFYYYGEDIEDVCITKYRQNIVYLPQRAQFFEGTVIDELKRIFEFKQNKTKDFSITDAQKYLEELDRSDSFLKKDVKSLSGGEEQIVSLIRALMLKPQVLLLDEFTSSLDKKSAVLCEKTVLRYLQNNKKRSCLVVSHSLEQTERLGFKVKKMLPKCFE